MVSKRPTSRRPFAYATHHTPRHFIDGYVILEIRRQLTISDLSLKVISVDVSGQLDLYAFNAMMTEKTRLVAMAYVS